MCECQLCTKHTERTGEEIADTYPRVQNEALETWMVNRFRHIAIHCGCHWNDEARRAAEKLVTVLIQNMRAHVRGKQDSDVDAYMNALIDTNFLSPPPE